MSPFETKCFNLEVLIGCLASYMQALFAQRLSWYQPLIRKKATFTIKLWLEYWFLLKQHTSNPTLVPFEQALVHKLHSSSGLLHASFDSQALASCMLVSIHKQYILHVCFWATRQVPPLCLLSNHKEMASPVLAINAQGIVTFMSP